MTRMPPMDLSDVAYKHVLVNGAPESTLDPSAGETVRVRLVNASTATYYFLEFAGGSGKILTADGTYEDAPPNPHLHGMGTMAKAAHDPVFLFGEGNALSNMSNGFITMHNNRNGLAATWEAGWENVAETSYEVDLTYDRYLNNFTSVFAGAELANDESGNRGIVGVGGHRGRLPLRPAPEHTDHHALVALRRG